MSLDAVGILSALQASPQTLNEIHVFAVNFFINRTPLVTRCPRLPVGSTTFNMISRKFRPRSTTLGASIADGSTTTITMADASTFMVGDVLEVDSERLEVAADPNTGNNTLTVTRAVEGTTGASHSNGATVNLIGNSRTGGEINQSATTILPVPITQYTQTWQHPVQVGGSLQASTAVQLPPGVVSPLDDLKRIALQNLMDDMEVTSYYGKGDSGSATGRPKQKGLKTLLATNNTTSPTNAAAYKATDFIRDTMEKCRSNGGDPDLLILSSNFMSGLSTWGQPLQRIDAGTTRMGIPIDLFEAPFLEGASLVMSPLLRPYSAICLTSKEVRMRMKRNEFWNPRGSRGDAVEGDFIGEGAIEVENESHHAWLEGITSFSAT